MAIIIYNKTYDKDVKNIDIIINFFENYKECLRKKEFNIYKKNLVKIMDVLQILEKEIDNEVIQFNKNDSDNEENYSDEYKNCESEDSISEYDTDTDDENTNNSRKKLVVKSTFIKNYYEIIKSELPTTFKKIKN
jgi:hypothetical protein